MTIKDLRASTNMTQREFGKYFGIPRRTIENWEGGVNTPPSYLVDLIRYKIDKEGLEVAGKGKDVYTTWEIVYIHEDNIEVIDEFTGNVGLTIDQALDLVNVDMDEYAEEKGWDGYDWNSIEVRIKN